MLTDEQKAIRKTGIGASEVSAILGLNPWKGPIDVWLVKRGIVQETESPKAEVGAILEAGVFEIYKRRTGFRATRRPITRRHRRFPHVLASPDVLVQDDDRGGEIKLVGANVAHHWENETVPDYVLAQAAQNMCVMRRARWDIIALVGGTDLRIHTITRDPDFEETLIEACEVFWAEHVETAIPPPIRDPEERKRYLRARYPGSAKTKCRELETTKAARLAAQYVKARATLERAKLRAEDVGTRLLELVGDDYGVEGSWGRFQAPQIAGRVDWKAVAEEMGGGTVPADLIEKHRGEAFRLPRFYAPKGART
jgi:putative phage-type endonuclease